MSGRVVDKDGRSLKLVSRLRKHSLIYGNFTTALCLKNRDGHIILLRWLFGKFVKSNIT